MAISVSSGPQASPEEVELLASQLCRELAELDSVTVTSPSHAAATTPGAKGPDVVGYGTLLVSVLNSSAITAVITLLGAWIRRRPAQRSARIRRGDREVELTGLTAAEMQQLVENLVDQDDEA